MVNAVVAQATRVEHPFVMEDALVVNEELTIPLGEIELRASRSSGPGGQHANVTASRIEAVFNVAASPTLTNDQRARLRERLGDQVSAVAQDARSQSRNRELALERLARQARGGVAPPQGPAPDQAITSRPGAPARAETPHLGAKAPATRPARRLSRT